MKKKSFAKVFLAFALVFLSIFGVKAYADSEYLLDVPDENFREYLVSLIEKNRPEIPKNVKVEDGYKYPLYSTDLRVLARQKKIFFDTHSKNEPFKSIKGIEYLEDLNEIFMIQPMDEIEEVDLSKNKNLREVQFQDMPNLKHINTEGLEKLRSFRLRNVAVEDLKVCSKEDIKISIGKLPIRSIDLTEVPELHSLEIVNPKDYNSPNTLKEVDFEGKKNVTWVWIENVGLEDVKHIEFDPSNERYIQLDFSNNNLKELNLNGMCDRLGTLVLKNNPISNIDVTRYPYMRNINVTGTNIEKVEIADSQRFEKFVKKVKMYKNEDGKYFVFIKDLPAGDKDTIVNPSHGMVNKKNDTVEFANEPLIPKAYNYFGREGFIYFYKNSQIIIQCELSNEKVELPKEEVKEEKPEIKNEGKVLDFVTIDYKYKGKRVGMEYGKQTLGKEIVMRKFPKGYVLDENANNPKIMTEDLKVNGFYYFDINVVRKSDLKPVEKIKTFVVYCDKSKTPQSVKSDKLVEYQVKGQPLVYTLPKGYELDDTEIIPTVYDGKTKTIKIYVKKANEKLNEKSDEKSNEKPDEKLNYDPEKVPVIIHYTIAKTSDIVKNDYTTQKLGQELNYSVPTGYVLDETKEKPGKYDGLGIDEKGYVHKTVYVVKQYEGEKVEVLEIPDENFRKLIWYGLHRYEDPYKDNELSENSIERYKSYNVYDKDKEYLAQVRALTIGNNDLKDITGIKYFESLGQLDLENDPNLKGRNEVKYVDLTHNKYLTHFKARQTGLEKIDFDAPKLEHVFIDDNKLTKLDLSKCPDLVRIDAAGNEITELILPEYPENSPASDRYLKWIFVEDNKLNIDNLDLTGYPALNSIDFSNNKIKSLDINSNKAFTIIKMNNTGLENVSHIESKVLDTFHAENNKLTKIDFSNSDLVRDLNIKNNNIAKFNAKDLVQIYAPAKSTSPQKITLKAEKTDKGYRVNLLDVMDKEDVENIASVKNGKVDKENCTIIFDKDKDISYEYFTGRYEYQEKQYMHVDVQLDVKEVKPVIKDKVKNETKDKTKDEVKNETKDNKENKKIIFSNSGRRSSGGSRSSRKSSYTRKRAEIKTAVTAKKAEVKTNIAAKKAEVKTAIDTKKAEVKAAIDTKKAEIKKHLEVIRKPAINVEKLDKKEVKSMIRENFEKVINKKVDKETKYVEVKEISDKYFTSKINRNEVVSMLTKILATEDVKKMDLLKDKTADEQLNQEANFILSTGIMSGYPDGTLQGDKPLTRAEFITILDKLNPQWKDGKDIKLKDAKDHWAKDKLQRAVANGVLSGFPDGTLRPDAPLTRAQTITLLNRNFNLNVNKDVKSDNLGSKWYTAQVLSVLR